MSQKTEKAPQNQSFKSYPGMDLLWDEESCVPLSCVLLSARGKPSGHRDPDDPGPNSGSSTETEMLQV